MREGERKSRKSDQDPLRKKQEDRRKYKGLKVSRKYEKYDSDITTALKARTLVAPGLTARNKDATRNKGHCYSAAFFREAIASSAT